MRSNGSGAERRATMPNRRSRTAVAQRVRSSDWLDGTPPKPHTCAAQDTELTSGGAAYTRAGRTNGSAGRARWPEKRELLESRGGLTQGYGTPPRVGFKLRRSS